MSRRRTPFEHYLDAVRLLARADEHLRFMEDNSINPAHRDIVNNLRSDIADYLKRKYPS